MHIFLNLQRFAIVLDKDGSNDLNAILELKDNQDEESNTNNENDELYVIEDSTDKPKSDKKVCLYF